jgi:hypothetical protein
VSEEQEAHPRADLPPSEKTESNTPTPPVGPAPPGRRNRWGWLLLVGGLAVVGVLLVLADLALGNPWLGPLASGGGRSAVIITPLPGYRPDPGMFDRSRIGQRLTIAAPFGARGPLSPVLALRELLSTGAGLIFIALGALILFPARARVAVERLEGSYGPAVALAAGVATLLLIVAATSLLRFSLLLLAAIPVVLVIALIAALFGIASISLAVGRLLQRRLSLPSTHPLLPALAGALVVFDLAVIPYAGVVAMLAVAIAGLGLAVVTRFGSAGGWSFGDLSW